MKQKINYAVFALALFAGTTTSLFAQGTAFTYQGRLNSGGSPASGLYDFRFKLYADPLGNTQVGPGYLTNGVPATNGLFVMTIDFGAGIFTGGTNWLEIDVRTNGAAGYTVLNPLQALTPTPDAIFAETAGNVSGTVSAAQIGGTILNSSLPASPNFSGTVTANQISGNGANVTNVNAAALNGLNAGNFWQLGGNNVPAGKFLGSTNSQPLELWVNSGRALRLEPDVSGEGAPNVIGGSPANSVAAGVTGATIGGGGSVLPAGYSNSVTGVFGTVGGGSGNSAGVEAVVGGGSGNMASNFSTIAGGYKNETIGIGATVAGGEYNGALGFGSYIGGGGSDGINSPGNNAFGNASVIGGGMDNYTFASYSTIGGGNANEAKAEYTVVAGGEDNVASGYSATVGGGEDNSATNSFDTVSGGQNNVAVGGNSFVGGGYGNSASNTFDTVSGGQFNNAAGGSSFVGSGYANSASGANSTIGGGYENTASGNYATVPGGRKNYAIGQFSFAAGEYAYADNDGTFVWSDTTGGGYEFGSTAANQFLIQAHGGVGIGTNSPNASLEVASTYNPQLRLDNQANDYARIRFAGYTNATWDIAALKSLNFFCNGYGNVLVLNNNGSATLSGTLNQGSDRNIKQDFTAISPAAVLAKVVGLPISEWTYKTDAQARHIGPMSQDFYAAFAVGPDDKHITTVDEGGVALAAIQGLNQKLESENAELKARLEKLEQVLLNKNGEAK